VFNACGVTVPCRELYVFNVSSPCHFKEQVVVEDELLHGPNEAVVLVQVVVIQLNVTNVHAPEVKLRGTPGYLRYEIK
jgi:hypothetical protein